VSTRPKIIYSGRLLLVFCVPSLVVNTTDCSLFFSRRDSLWATLGLLGAVILLLRFAQMFNAHLRHLFSLTASSRQQQFWSTNHTSLWPNLKSYFLYAPLWKKRHNREMRLSAAINMGTLPSRFHTTILLLYMISNLAYCCVLDYSKPKPEVIAELRGRTGVLALFNMIPLVILAGRNNPLIAILRVSFDTYNLLHRWMGRIVVVESLAHTLAWASNKVLSDGWEKLFHSLKSPFFQSGTFGTVAMVLIMIQSPSPIRHAFYETFLNVHILLALTTVIAVWVHLDIPKLPPLHYIWIVMFLWAFDRIVRLVRIVYRNISRSGSTTVSVQALPGEACRVTLNMPRPWTFKPGCHVYLYLPSIALWQSHPFSVAWGEEIPVLSRDEENEKLPSTVRDLQLPTKNRATISLVIHKRTGMTAKLYDRAKISPNGCFTVRGFAEGPYGGLESLHSYGTVMMFAGGIGITHQVPHIRDLVQGYSNGTVATRKVILVWTVKTTEHLEWVRPWMDVILQLPGRREILKILLFITKPRSPREVVSPSATVQMFPGRPTPQVLLDKEIENRVGAMAVTVCGPGALADSVRDAARKRVDVASLDFIEESFTW
jgi:predicted ferric reductase